MAPKKRTMTAAQIEELRRLANNNVPITKIAKKFDCSVKWLKGYLDELNIPRPKLQWTPLSASEKRRVFAGHAAGKSALQIAKELGRAPIGVLNAASAAGLRFDRHRPRGTQYEGPIGKRHAEKLRRLIISENRKTADRRLTRMQLAKKVCARWTDVALRKLAAKHGIELPRSKRPLIAPRIAAQIISLAAGTKEREPATVPEICREMGFKKPHQVHAVRRILASENRRRANAGEEPIEIRKAPQSGRERLDEAALQMIQAKIQAASPENVPAVVAELASEYKRSIPTIRREAGLVAARRQTSKQHKGEKKPRRVSPRDPDKVPRKPSALFVENGQALFVPSKHDFVIREAFESDDRAKRYFLQCRLDGLAKRPLMRQHLPAIRSWFVGETPPEGFTVATEPQRDAMERATAVVALRSHSHVWKDGEERTKIIPWTPIDLWAWVQFVFAAETTPLGRYVIHTNAKSLRVESVPRAFSSWTVANRVRLTHPGVLDSIKRVGDGAPLNTKGKNEIDRLIAPLHERTRSVLMRFAEHWAGRFDRSGVSRQQRKKMLDDAEAAGGKAARADLKAFVDGDHQLPGRNCQVFTNRTIDSLTLFNSTPAFEKYCESARAAGKPVWQDAALRAVPCFQQWVLQWLGLSQLTRSQPPLLNRAERRLICDGRTIQLGPGETEVLYWLARANPDRRTRFQLRDESSVERPDRALRLIVQKLPPELRSSISFPGVAGTGYFTTIRLSLNT